jgi:hypothetical protein
MIEIAIDIWWLAIYRPFGPGTFGNNLLLEDGSDLLLETGDALLTE